MIEKLFGLIVFACLVYLNNQASRRSQNSIIQSYSSNRFFPGKLLKVNKRKTFMESAIDECKLTISVTDNITEVLNRKEFWQQTLSNSIKFASYSAIMLAGTDLYGGIAGMTIMEVWKIKTDDGKPSEESKKMDKWRVELEECFKKVNKQIGDIESKFNEDVVFINKWINTMRDELNKNITSMRNKMIKLTEDVKTQVNVGLINLKEELVKVIQQEGRRLDIFADARLLMDNYEEQRQKVFDVRMVVKSFTGNLASNDSQAKYNQMNYMCQKENPLQVLLWYYNNIVNAQAGENFLQVFIQMFSFENDKESLYKLFRAVAVDVDFAYDMTNICSDFFNEESPDTKLLSQADQCSKPICLRNETIEKIDQVLEEVKINDGPVILTRFNF